MFCNLNKYVDAKDEGAFEISEFAKKLISCC
jgi:hypothetical protein